MELTLSNSQILALQADIHIASDSTTKSVAKLYLTDLLDKSITSLTPFNKIREDLTKKYATKEDDGTLILKKFKDGTDLANATEADLTDGYKEYIDILNVETQISFTPIPVKIFDGIETNQTYQVLHKFVKLD